MSRRPSLDRALRLAARAHPQALPLMQGPAQRHIRVQQHTRDQAALISARELRQRVPALVAGPGMLALVARPVTQAPRRAREASASDEVGQGPTLLPAVRRIILAAAIPPGITAPLARPQVTD